MLVFLFLKFRQKYVYLAELKGLNNFAVHGYSCGICRRMRDHIVIGEKKKKIPNQFQLFLYHNLSQVYIKYFAFVRDSDL